MRKFPSAQYVSVEKYATDYFSAIAQASQAVDYSAITRAADLLSKTVMSGGKIFSCGNGGSAAIAEHLTCDFLKGVRTGTHIKPHVTSLVSTVSLITAIGNDYGYEKVFCFQLESLAKAGDILITISSSGNSPNILNALVWAKSNNVATIALTGFSGGEAAKLADVTLHVPANNYGVVEDIHQSIMHLLAQFMRQSQLSQDAFNEAVF